MKLEERTETGHAAGTANHRGPEEWETGCRFGAWSSEVPRVSPSLIPLETKQARELGGEVNYPNRSTLPSAWGPAAAAADPALSGGHQSRQPCPP